MKIARVWGRACAGLVLLAIAGADAGDLRFDVVRLDGAATREAELSSASLRVTESVIAGDRVRTGADGHVVLHLPPVGALTLGTESSLYVHSIDAEDLPARSALARVVLEYGTARINARSQQQLPPADLRINMGALRLRVFGAEIWASRLAGTEEICLLAGAIELQGTFGARRLDQPGHCLRTSPTGLLEQDANSASAMAPRLNLTAFPGDPTMQWAASMAANEPQPAAAPPSDREPGLAPVPNASIEETPAPPVPATHEAADGWTIVLASLPESAAAEREADRLRGIGLAVDVVESVRDDGSRTYRVVSGRYASKSDAAPDIENIRARRGLRSAWLAPLR